MDWTNPLTLTLTAGSAVAGLIIGVLIQKLVLEKRFQSKEKTILEKLEKDKRTLKNKQKEFELEFREELRRARGNWEKERKKSKTHILDQINNSQLQDKELIRKNRYFDSQITELEKKIQKTSSLIQETIAFCETKKPQEMPHSFTPEEARTALQEKLKNTIQKETEQAVQSQLEQLEQEIKKEHESRLANEIKAQAQNFVRENAVITLTLADDKLKGQIIGREGRNIRTFESITGTNIIIDETPSTIQLSSFDTLKKEVAKLSIEQLLKEGKINPQRIEEVYQESKNKILLALKEKGLESAKQLGIQNIHPQLLRLIGKLSYHTYLGKINLLQHIEDTVRLAESLAKDLKEDPTLPKRAIFLHQIGRALDHHHPKNVLALTLAQAKEHGESESLLRALSQHQDWRLATDPFSLITALSIETADLRPGSLTETLKNYLLRQEEIEKIFAAEEKLSKCYAFLTEHHTRVWMAIAKEADELGGHQKTRDFCYRVKEKVSLKGGISVVVACLNKNLHYSL